MLDTMEKVFCFVKNLNHPYSIWISENLDPFNLKDILLDEIFQELRYSYSNKELSHSLKYKIEKLPRVDRKELVSRVKDGCPALFLACKKGNLEMVKFLIENCDADPEQIGIYEVLDENTVHRVTPLWAAAVSGNLSIVKYLVKVAKVNINSCSDTGSTVVRSACYMAHYDIVKFLIENGADISKSNSVGGNCLINSVSSYKLCELLLEHGADVNASDSQNKTALHYAIYEHHYEVAVLLLKHGADPTIKTHNDEDALCLACLKLETNIFNFLIKNIYYTNERIANAYELMGCSILDELKDVQEALSYWRKGLMIRMNSEPLPIVKKNLVEPKKVYLDITEFQTFEELDEVSTNIDLIRIQSLLICERILGHQHNNTIFRLMFRGASYADNLQHKRCIVLWKYALKLRIKKDTIFHSESGFAAQALVRLFLNLIYSEETHDDQLCFQDVYKTLLILFYQLEYIIDLLKIQPVFKKQQDDYDEILKMIINLILVLDKLKKTNNEEIEMKKIVIKLINLNPRTSQGDTLLHLIVSTSATLKSTEINSPKDVFPNYEIAKLFLECGSNPNLTNNKKDAPLHLASMRPNYNKKIVNLLLNNGAHLDQKNLKGSQPMKQLLSIKESKIEPLKYITLKCLAAKKLNQNQTKHSSKKPIPYFLNEFVNIH